MIEKVYAEYFPPNPTKHGWLSGLDENNQKIVHTYDDKPVTTELIKKHLHSPEEAMQALGQLAGSTSHTNVGVIDLDTDKYPDHESLFNTMERIRNVASSLKLNVYLEESTRGGYHLYVFSNRELAYNVMRAALRSLAELSSTEVFETYPAGDDSSSTWLIQPYAGAANDPKRLGRTYLVDTDGQAIPYDELDEWIYRSPFEELVSLALMQTDSILESSKTVDLKPEAFELIKEAILKPPPTFQRHSSLKAFLNLGERSDKGKDMLDFLKTEQVMKVWVSDGSRTLAKWKEEIDRWAKAKPNSEGKSLGIKFLSSQGFNIPDLPSKETKETLPPVEFEAITPLPEIAQDPPDLPSDLLPPALREWLEDVSQRTSTHLAFTAMAGICALGAVIGRTLGIHPKKFDNWLEVPNLWGGIVAPPSSMKSSAISEGSVHIKRLAVKATDDFNEQALHREAKIDLLKAEINVGKKAAKNKPALSANDLAALKKQIQNLENETEKRYIINDATLEKTGELLKDNPRGLLQLRDELVGLLQACDKSGFESYRPFLLESWNGKGSYTFDRIGRGTMHIPALTLSIFGGIQPGKLRSYINGAITNDNQADGLLQRFQLLVWFDRPKKWERVDRYANTEAKNKAFCIYEYLDQLDPALMGIYGDELDPESIPALHFDYEAQELFNTWLDHNMNRVTSDAYKSTPAFASHLIKYNKLVPCLALTFYLVEAASQKASTLQAVSCEALELAIAWSEYLELHAEKLYSLELNQDLHSAHALAEKIKEDALTDGQTLRELYRAGWSGLRSSDDVKAALELLEKHNWLKVQKLENTATGGRPKEVLRLNPNVVTA